MGINDHLGLLMYPLLESEPRFGRQGFEGRVFAELGDSYKEVGCLQAYCSASNLFYQPYRVREEAFSAHVLAIFCISSNGRMQMKKKYAVI